MKRERVVGASSLRGNRRVLSFDRGRNPLPRNAPSLEQAKSAPPFGECGEDRRLSSRTTKVRGSSSMTSCPLVLVALFADVSLARLTANHGAHAFSDGAHAKAHNRRPSWENSSGNRLSWRSCFFPMALTPKPAGGLGKIPAVTVYLGDFPMKKRESRQNPRLAGGLGKTIWKRFIMAISS